jgi:NADH-quinone oxidoreductase subunit G
MPLEVVMATIWIDGETYEVDESRNLLDVCLSLGLKVPYFCWHPALGSVGACRQCAVKQFKDEHDTQGEIVMACMTPATHGTRISIRDPEARHFHATVIKWLMANHPHDCPVCDEGGECHLQDMTVLTGHVYREHRLPKRTHRNQDLGPFINHEMNRCIQCYRCVRFYCDYAGGRDLDVLGAHDDVYFGRYDDGPFENEFSGNLVEVCPTGVFTDKSLKKHSTRKWDLQTAPSVCVHCAVGCNTIPGERYGTLRRIRSRYNSDVNRYFLCDRGRYGYEFVNDERRIRHAMRPRGVDHVADRLDHDTAVAECAKLLGEGRRVLGIGSPRASLESNFALQTLVGQDHYCSGMRAAEQNLASAIVDVLCHGPSRAPSLGDVERCDAILVLGEDLTNTAPLLALSLRQAARNQPMKRVPELDVPLWLDSAVRNILQQDTGPVFVLTPTATKLDAVARRVCRTMPEDAARLACAVAHALDNRAPAAAELSKQEKSLVQEIAAGLRDAERPLIVSGTGCGSEALIRAAANVAWACRGDHEDAPAALHLTVPECNTMGVALLGGIPLDEALARLRDKRYDAVVVLENDLGRRLTPAAIDELFSSGADVVVLDYLAHEFAGRARLVLPAATFAEGHGTLVSSEGRAQRSYQVFKSAQADVQESWAWLGDVADALQRRPLMHLRTIDDLILEIAAVRPGFARLLEGAPPADFRIDGARVPRELHRYSGRTAMHANVTMHEPKPAEDPDSPFAFSMEGARPAPPKLAPEFLAPGRNSPQAVTWFQEKVNGPLHGSPVGVRLIEPTPGRHPHYVGDVPPKFQPRDDALRVVGLHYIFGSDELGMLSVGVAESAPEMHVALNPADADALGVQSGGSLHLDFGDVCGEWLVQVRDDLPRGTVGVPVGLPEGIPGPLPEWCGTRKT